MSLEKLLKGLTKEKPKAQAELYTLYARTLFGVSLKYSRNYEEAEDNLQDAFLTIFKKVHQYKGKGSFEGWLKRIVILAVVLLLAWLAVMAVQNWTSSHKDDADVPKIKNSEVEILPMGNVAATSGDQLVLNFSRPTSVHIVDATGKVLATGRQASTLNLSGESPFQIRLDDATAVALTLNQEQISLSPYTVNGKAEFRLSR